MSSIEKWSPAYMLALTEKLVREGITTSCINCASFSNDDEICRIYQERPPAKIIAIGCPAWTQDIPF